MPFLENNQTFNVIFFGSLHVFGIKAFIYLTRVFIYANLSLRFLILPLNCFFFCLCCVHCVICPELYIGCREGIYIDMLVLYIFVFFLTFVTYCRLSFGWRTLCQRDNYMLVLSIFSSSYFCDLLSFVIWLAYIVPTR